MQPQSFTLAFNKSIGELYVGSANADAVALINAWQKWQDRSLYLYGQHLAGKTCLSRYWSDMSGAVFLDCYLDDSAVAKISYTRPPAVVLDDVHSVVDQNTLFHFLNVIKQNNIFLLMTSELSLSELPFDLLDLTSRLRAMQSVAIQQPDDELLQHFLRSHFLKRGVHLNNDVISYIWPRITRTFAGVAETVKLLDNASLNMQKEISIPFVRQILEVK